MAKNRNYSFSDVNMIMAAKIIAANFKTNLPELSTLRTNWTNEYASDLAGRINHAIENYLGLDAKKELRNATRQLFDIMKKALQSLAAFKIQVDDDFKGDPPRREDVTQESLTVSSTGVFSIFFKAILVNSSHSLKRTKYQGQNDDRILTLHCHNYNHPYNNSRFVQQNFLSIHVLLLLQSVH